jgi:hypothetical protein
MEAQEEPHRIAGWTDQYSISHHCASKAGPRIAQFIGMDYEKMKALLETSREESTAQRNPEVKEFPHPDSRPDWKYLDHVAKERIAA